MTRKHFYFTIILLTALACQSEKGKGKGIKHLTNDLQVDHLNIWVQNPSLAKEKLIEIGFTAVPDSLSQIHHGQGTAGRYVNFFNAYLELIFISDHNTLTENASQHKDLDFLERANCNNNGASPFSVALKVRDYDLSKIPFETVPYHQNWMGEGENIYAARTSKTQLKAPSVFVVYPEIEASTFESLIALEETPSEDDYWKTFFKHPNGAQKLTGILVTSTDRNLKTGAIKAVNDIQNISVINGNDHLMELYFDNRIQGKSFDLRPELPLIIHL